MAEPTPEEIEQTNKTLQQARDLFGAMFLEGVNDQDAVVSKALFPDTHTVDLEIDGKTMKLRPVPIKTSKALYDVIKPFSDQYAKAMKDTETVFNMNLEAVKSLKDACSILCSYYSTKEPEAGWDKIQKAIMEDDISMSEMQLFAVLQERLNGTNDFLLSPLRTLLAAMRTAELLVAKTQAFFSTQGSHKSGTAVSTT